MNLFFLYLITSRHSITFSSSIILRVIWRLTIHTLLVIRASKFSRIGCSILLACGFWNSVLICKFVHIYRFTSLARPSSKTINKNLRCKSNLGPSIFSFNINSISQSRGSSLSPTATAIDGNVLIGCPT